MDTAHSRLTSASQQGCDTDRETLPLTWHKGVREGLCVSRTALEGAISAPVVKRYILSQAPSETGEGVGQWLALGATWYEDHITLIPEIILTTAEPSRDTRSPTRKILHKLPILHRPYTQSWRGTGAGPDPVG